MGAKIGNIFESCVKLCCLFYFEGKNKQKAESSKLYTDFLETHHLKYSASASVKQQMIISPS